MKSGCRNPYAVFSRKVDPMFDRMMIIHTTEIAKKTLDATWLPFSKSIMVFTGDDIDAPITVDILEANTMPGMKPKLIGTCNISLSDLTSGVKTLEWPLLNPEKMEKFKSGGGKLYHNSGVLRWCLQSIPLKPHKATAKTPTKPYGAAVAAVLEEAAAEKDALDDEAATAAAFMSASTAFAADIDQEEGLENYMDGAAVEAVDYGLEPETYPTLHAGTAPVVQAGGESYFMAGASPEASAAISEPVVQAGGESYFMAGASPEASAAISEPVVQAGGESYFMAGASPEAGADEDTEDDGAESEMYQLASASTPPVHISADVTSNLAHHKESMSKREKQRKNAAEVTARIEAELSLTN